MPSHFFRFREMEINCWDLKKLTKKNTDNAVFLRSKNFL